MFNYYITQIIPKKTETFKFGIDTDGQTKLYQLNKDKSAWLPIRIRLVKTTEYYFEYELDPEDSSLVGSLREPRGLRTNNLGLTLKSGGQSFYFDLTPCRLGKETETLPVQSTNKAGKSTTEHKRENPQGIHYHHGFKLFAVSEEKKGKLREHKETLKNRSSEYKLLSQILNFFLFCFEWGYSKSEKIEQIDNILNNRPARECVVTQGETGNIMNMNL